MEKEVIINELTNLKNSYFDMLSNNRNEISEEKIRSGYINKMLELFGWNLSNLNEVVEEKVLTGIAKNKLKKIKSSHLKPDYQLLDRGVLRMYLDAKTAPSDFRNSKQVAFQIRSYGWSSNLKLSIVSNFEYFTVYDTSFMPNIKMDPTFRSISFTINDLILEFDKYSTFFMKNDVQNGNWNLESFGIDSHNKDARSLDKEFLMLISDFRLTLGDGLIKASPNLSSAHLNYFVQVITNRIIFIRILEDLEYEPFQKLLTFLENGKNFWNQFQKSSQNEFFYKYDGALFQEILNINLLENNIFEKFIYELYGDTPYRFNVISPSIIAEIYDIFLSKQLIIKDNSVAVHNKILSPSGAVPTPYEISKFICEKTLDIDKINTLSEVKKIKLIDPCVGSGSFLVSAFDLIVNRIKEIKNNKVLDYWELKDIITNSLYGVDIDPVALEVLKMTMSIKLITTEHKKIEPVSSLLSEFSDNFKLGNTLVDTDDSSKLLPKNEIELQYPSNYHDLFPEIFIKQKGFTHLVGNPPYIEPKHFKEHFPETLDYLKKKYVSNKGKADISMFFLERFFELVKEDGKVGTIIQNRFFKTSYGKPLRQFLSKKGYITEIIDYKTNKLFYGKITYVSIILGVNNKNSNVIYRYSKGNVNKTRGNLTGIISNKEQQILISQKDLENSSIWSYLNFKANNIYKDLINNSVNRGFFTINSNPNFDIIVGPQVLDSKFFLIKDINFSEGKNISIANRRDENILIERNIIKKVLRNDELESFKDFNEIKKFDYMIFPYYEDGTFITMEKLKSNFPLSMNYFEFMKKESTTKKRTEKSEFYRFTREQNHDSYNKPKIFIPMTHKRVVASFSDKPMFGDNSNVNAVISKNDNIQELKALCALMNSKIFSLLAIPISGEQSGNYRKLNKQFLGEVLIPNLTSKEIKLLANINDEIIYQKQLYENRFGESAKLTKSHIIKLQNKLDEYVEKLYGISYIQKLELEKIVKNENIFNEDLDWARKYK